MKIGVLKHLKFLALSLFSLVAAPIFANPMCDPSELPKTLEKLQIQIAAGYRADEMCPSEYSGPDPAMFHLFSKATPEMIRLALTTYPDIELKNARGKTALQSATHLSKHLEIITILLEAGANITYVSDGTSAIGYAYFSRDETIIPKVRLLIKAGADVNENIGIGETPLHSALGYSQTPDQIQFLLDAGAIVDPIDPETGETPLFSETRYPSQNDGVLVLLNAGADPNIINLEGETPLMHVLGVGLFGSAATDGISLRNMNALLDAGADIKVIGPFGQNMLEMALKTGLGVQNLAGVRLLLKRGFDIETPFSEGSNFVKRVADAVILEKMKNDGEIQNKRLYDNALLEYEKAGGKLCNPEHHFEKRSKDPKTLKRIVEYYKSAFPKYADKLLAADKSCHKLSANEE